MLSVAWVLCTLVWTASALNITKPRAGDTIDISFPYNVTWTWTDQDANDQPLIRMQITPTFEESSNIITAAGIATFWADGAIVSAQDLVAASPVQIQLVNPEQFNVVYAVVGPIYLVNSANISAAPSTYSTTIYPATPLATSSPSTPPSATFSTTTSTSAPASAPASTSTSPSASASASASASQTPSLSGGAIAGIVIGVLAAVALVAAGVFFNKRRLRHSKSDTDDHTRGQWSKPEIPHENQVYEVHAPKNNDRWGRYELDSQIESRHPTTASRGYP